MIKNGFARGGMMSKLFDTYLEQKKKDKETIYLFKNGVFFIAINDDAYTLSKLFHFKLTNLNDNILKCGFPCSSFDKYFNLFSQHNLKIKIIELNNKIIYQLKDYTQSIRITELLNDIKSVDINSLSIQEAYKFIENLKYKVAQINNGDKNS